MIQSWRRLNGGLCLTGRPKGAGRGWGALIHNNDLVKSLEALYLKNVVHHELFQMITYLYGLSG